MSAEASSDPVPEFSRPVPVDEIGARETVMTIEANAEERAALARRFDLIAIDALSARVGLRRCMARDGSGVALRLRFDLAADVVQRCVVTLVPLRARIEETELEIEYRLDGDDETESEVNISLETVDPPENLDDDRIDLGEVVAEHLALELDPYPRAEGAKSDWRDPAGGTDDAAEGEHPFAALRDWSRRAPSEDN